MANNDRKQVSIKSDTYDNLMRIGAELKIPEEEMSTAAVIRALIRHYDESKESSDATKNS